jgi:hypothetical protein
MSKIARGEWNAIAARYARGESISKIAQSYECTPPAIHYILKQHKQRLVQTVEQPPIRPQESPPSVDRETPMQATPQISRSSGTHGDVRERSELPSAQSQAVAVRASGFRDRESTAALAGPPLSQQSPKPQTPDRSSAFAAGLDSDLQRRAEAAIEAFRTSFDAALTEGSPMVRQRLRQAASDLMRIAARTTIVLDRLNAGGERASAPASAYPGKLGPMQGNSVQRHPGAALSGSFVAQQRWLGRVSEDPPGTLRRR